MKNKGFIILFFACMCYSTIEAQQEESARIKMNMDLTADEKGKVAVNLKIVYSALSWDMYKQKQAHNPSIVKNSLKKEFIKYQLTDFTLKNEDMDRTIYITFNLLGLLKLAEDGRWIAELDTKDPDITKISETQYLMVDEDFAQSYKVNLPKNASHSKIEKDAFGKAILTYDAPVTEGTGQLLKYSGFLFIAAGVFLFFRNYYAQKHT